MAVVSRVKKYVSLYDIIMILIIIFFSIIIPEKRAIPLVMNDEFGYWGNAKFFFSDSWKPLMTITPYYSIGYSILLVPFMFFTSNMEIIYQCAIITNVILLIISYFIIRYIIFNKYSIKDIKYISILSLTVILSSENLMHSQIAWSETLLTFLMWLSVGLVFSISLKYSYNKLIILLMVWLFMYLVHQRTIGIVLGGIVIVFFICIKEKKIIPLITVIISLPIILCTQRMISSVQTQIILSDSVVSEVNVLNVNTSMIKDTLSRIIYDIKAIIISVLGKYFYLSVTSFFTVPVALFSVGTSVTKLIKKRKYELIDISELYIIMSLVIMFVLTSIRMYGNGRMDLVVYSRYFEFTIGPVIMIGILALLNSMIRYKYIIICSFGLIIIMVEYIINEMQNAKQEFNIYCSPHIGAFYLKSLQISEKGLEIKNSIYTIVLICFFLLVTIMIASRMKNKNISIMLVCTIFIVINLCVFQSLEAQMIKWQNNLYASIEPVVEELNKDKEKKIYYLDDFCKTGYGNEMKYLQFVLGDRSIELLNDDISSLNEKEFFLIVDGNQEDIFDGLKKIEGTIKYTLYRR